MVHSLYQSLNNLETIYADRIGIRYYDEAKGGVVEVPFRQYAADLRRFVAFLRSRTPNPLGQRVAILARNSYHYVMCLYGAVLAGAVAVPLNTGKNWDEIRYELDLVEPVCVLHDGEYLSREPALGQVYGDRLVPMDAFTAFEPAMDITEVPDLSALAFIMFTSGTTGRSKGVMLSQKNLFTAMPAFLTPFEDVRSQTGWNTDAFSSLSCLPMFHISAMTSLVSWSVTGHCVNLCDDLKYFYRDLGAMRSDVMAVVPVLLKSIYHDVMKGKRERLNGLRVLTCGAAMFDPAVLQDLMDRGCFIAQMYGLTETCGDGAWNSSQEEKYLTSVGHGDDSCQYKLEDGELCMRGDPVMLGYYKDVNLMKGAIMASNFVTTVSPTYAQELRLPFYAHGLAGVINEQSGKLQGILNGIDTQLYDPAATSGLAANFSARSLVKGKAECKLALQRAVGLEENADVQNVWHSLENEEDLPE